MRPTVFVEHSHSQRAQHRDTALQAVLASRYAIGLCTQGQCQLHINGLDYSYQQGDCLCIVPDSQVQGTNYSLDYAGVYVIFEPELVHLLARPQDTFIYRKLLQQPICKLDIELTYLMKKYVELIDTYLQGNQSKSYKRLSFKLLLESFQLKFYGLFVAQATLNFSKQNYAAIQSDYSLFEAFLNDIYLYHKEERAVDFYAARQGLNSRTFTQRIKKISGYPAKKWISEVTLSTVKSLLIETELSLKEIAAELHFSSASVFNTFFRTAEQLSPLDFTKQHKGYWTQD